MVESLELLRGCEGCVFARGLDIAGLINDALMEESQNWPPPQEGKKTSSFYIESSSQLLKSGIAIVRLQRARQNCNGTDCAVEKELLETAVIASDNDALRTILNESKKS